MIFRLGLQVIGTCAMAMALALPAQAADVILSTTHVGGTGTDLAVPVRVGPLVGLDTARFRFTFDPAVVQATRVLRTATSHDFGLTFDLSAPGVVDLPSDLRPADPRVRRHKDW